MIRSILTLLVAVSAQPTFASFEFSPIIAKVAPGGQGASTNFTVTNASDKKVAIQISIVAREPDETGKEVYKETDAVKEVFKIFPAQLVLESKQARNVIVRYIGSPSVKSEMPFRIIAEELPIDLTDPNKKYKTAVAQVNIATRYVGSLYVTPPGAKSVMSFEAEHGGGQNLNLVIKNTGTAHQVVRQPVLKLKSVSSATEITMSGTDVKSLVNLNVLPGKTRKFTLAWPKSLPVGPVKASIDLPQE